MKLYSDQRIHFPHPTDTTYEGLLLVDDNISTEILLEAYSFGIFPWPQENLPLLWFSPPERGVLNFSNYHVSKSFEKFLRKTTFKTKFNTAFSQVVENCQKAYRPDQEGTWITNELKDAYLDFHRSGYAHSIECWDEDRLVGGLYGVYVAGVFCGESMFFIEPNASKYALHSLILFLKSKGLEWMDIQMVTPLLKSMGAEYVRRKVYLDKLQAAKDCAKQISF